MSDSDLIDLISRNLPITECAIKSRRNQIHSLAISMDNATITIIYEKADLYAAHDAPFDLLDSKFEVDHHGQPEYYSSTIRTSSELRWIAASLPPKTSTKMRYTRVDQCPTHYPILNVGRPCTI